MVTVCVSMSEIEKEILCMCMCVRDIDGLTVSVCV